MNPAVVDIPRKLRMIRMSWPTVASSGSRTLAKRSRLELRSTNEILEELSDLATRGSIPRRHQRHLFGRSHSGSWRRYRTHVAIDPKRFPGRSAEGGRGRLDKNRSPVGAFLLAPCGMNQVFDGTKHVLFAPTGQRLTES